VWAGQVGFVPVRAAPNEGIAVESTVSRTRHVILAGIIGNVLEWYDFSVNG
jgi:hypothetical protein